MDVEPMAAWALRKGINLLGTGDFTHPLWFRQLQSKLEETSSGIYSRKGQTIKFILTAEISSIYSQGGKTRRIHNLILAPNFETVGKINQELTKKGVNLMSDGRPIIGLSSPALCELVWTINEDCLIISAHAWTPWFSLYGSKSGFDSIEECYGPFANRIYAIETGLSSAPAMNWQIEELDNRSILSFSDAHSPAKLGREATVFKIRNPKSEIRNEKNFAYKDLAEAIKQDKNSNWEIAYTIEFYPEEGKYHYTGHRACGVSQSPQETKKSGTICPVCGRPLTVGVMHRVQELSRDEQIYVKNKYNAVGVKGIYNANQSRPPYILMVPLLEIIAQSLETSSSSQKAMEQYDILIEKLGSEFDILLRATTDQINSVSDHKIGEAIKKVRQGEISIKPGFDGLFGVVKIWGSQADNKPTVAKKQLSLF